MDSNEHINWTSTLCCKRDQLFLRILILPQVDKFGCVQTSRVSWCNFYSCSYASYCLLTVSIERHPFSEERPSYRSCVELWLECVCCVNRKRDYVQPVYCKTTVGPVFLKKENTGKPWREVMEDGFWTNLVAWWWKKEILVWERVCVTSFQLILAFSGFFSDLFQLSNPEES